MRPSQTYCAKPEVLVLLHRDGLGWGHDLDCGTFVAAPQVSRRRPLARLLKGARHGAS